MRCDVRRSVFAALIIGVTQLIGPCFAAAARGDSLWIDHGESIWRVADGSEGLEVSWMLDLSEANERRQPHIVVAQAMDGFDIFSRILDMVSVKAAQEAWAGQASSLTECIDRKLNGEGTSVYSLIENGIVPSDPRLSPYVRECNGEVAAAKRQRTDRELKKLAERAQAGADNLDPNSLSAFLGEVEEAMRRGASDSEVREFSIRLQSMMDGKRRTGEWSRAYVELTSAKDAAVAAVRSAGTAPLKTRLDVLLASYRAISPTPTRTLSVTSAYSLKPCGEQASIFARLICTDEEARWVVLDYSRAYYLLRHFAPEAKEQAANASRLFQERLTERCRVGSAKRKQALDCVTEGFESRTLELRESIRSLNKPDALDELDRSIQRHLNLQGRLQEFGYLSADAEIDGIYGPKTREAIARFQTATHQIPDGVLDNETASYLEPDATSAELDEMIALTKSLSALVADASEVALRNERLQTAKSLLVGRPLQFSLRSFLERYVSASSLGEAQRATLEHEFDEKADEILLATSIQSKFNDRNSALIEGAGYLVAYNATPSAPNVRKSLRGDLVFSGVPRLCLLVNSPPDIASRGVIRRALGALGIETRPMPDTCDVANIDSVDVIIAEAGYSAAPWLLGMLDALGSASFRTAALIGGREIEAEKSRRQQLEKDVLRAIAEPTTGEAYGVLLVDRSEPSVCAVIESDAASHSLIFEEIGSALFDEFEDEPVFRQESSEAAFIAATRRECGAVYANLKNLSLLASAFQRDELAFTALPILVDDAIVAKLIATFESRLRLEAERQADAERRARDNEALHAAKEADRNLVRARQQAELQKQYGSVAKAIELRLTTELVDFVEGGSGDHFALKYPDLAEVYQGLLTDRWEYVSAEHGLVDYGTGVLKGRTLEVAFVRSQVQLRNRILGEYKTFCVITGFIQDAEFQMDREPIGVACDRAKTPLESYKIGIRFESRWLVE